MASLSRVFNRTSIALCSGLALTAGSAQAQGSDGRLPPPPLPIPSSAGPSAGPAAAPAGAPAPGSTAGASTPASPPIAVQDLTVVSGAGEEQRRALLGRIMEAKNQGIGISTYMMAFDALEQSAKGGETEPNILKRVTSLNSSLDDQFKRGAILKTQRAAPPVAASSASAPMGGPGGGPPANTDTAALIQKLQSKYGASLPDLQNKYGDKIPDNLKDKIPTGTGGDPSALLKNPEVQDLLRKFQK